jgi:DNA-binding NtrC family response regulator
MPDRKIWVLIIDDNLVVRKTTGKLLRKEGFEIILAENAEEAMGFIELCTPDCILLDVLMPKVHGQAFLSWLRKIHPTLPVIVVSGIERQPALVAAMEKLGIAGWVSKPGNPKEVAKIIRKAIEPEKETTNADLETTTPDDGQPKGTTKEE